MDDHKLGEHVYDQLAKHWRAERGLQNAHWEAEERAGKPCTEYPRTRVFVLSDKHYGYLRAYLKSLRMPAVFGAEGTWDATSTMEPYYVGDVRVEPESRVLRVNIDTLTEVKEA